MAEESLTSEVNLLTEAGLVPRKTPISQAVVFIKKCKLLGASPFRNEIFLKDKYDENGKRIFVTIMGINGYRNLSTKTGEYTGSDAPTFNGGISLDDMLKKKTPVRTCAIVVYRKGNPFTAEVIFDDYMPDQGTDTYNFWKAKPYLMISKCAEAMALRKAFSDVLGGTYIEEELDHVDGSEAYKDKVKTDTKYKIKTAIDSVTESIASKSKKK